MNTTTYAQVPGDDIGWLTTDQMREVDRVMIEDLGIILFQMMENAGRNLARLAIDRYSPKSPVVAFGNGGNGGGGLVCARHLSVSGVPVRVVLATDRESLTPVPKAQLEIIEKIGVPVLTDVPDDADLFIDAVIGYSLSGDPRGRAGEVIAEIDSKSVPILSLDTPSGLDTASGVAGTPHIKADATMTLALPKNGLREHDSVGQLFLADISVPGFVYENMGVPQTPDFSHGTILEILR